MKNTLLICAALLGAATMTAQTEPNRLMVRQSTEGMFKSYVLDRVESIEFTRVDGPVEAKIDILDVDQKSLVVDVTRTAACASYYLNVMPQNVANQLTDPARMFSYLEELNSPTYAEDFAAGELSGIEFVAGGDYCIVTGAMDEYGTQVSICRADFKAYTPPVQGNPQVKAEVVSTSLYDFTVKFTPNSDVAAYYTVAGAKGEIEKQYEMFGPMMGASRLDDLIKAWGIKETTACEKSWDDMAPNTEYEVFIAIVDKKGNFAPMEILELSTQSLGGPGEASVTVTPGKYVMADWFGEQKPSQFFKFTPNDQASCYRFNVVKKDLYDADPAGYKADLCKDPEMTTAYYFFYETLETDFQLDPNTQVVVIAAAKNVNNEWGPVTELNYTTPAQTENAMGAYTATRNDITMRLTPERYGFRPGYCPTFSTGASRITIR